MFGPAVWWYDCRCMEGRAMRQVLHGSATTTEAIHRAIQARQESVRAAAKRYRLSPTTVQKWRVRETVADARMGPKQPRSSVLSQEDEAVVVAFRRHTLLPLDDCLYALQPSVTRLQLNAPQNEPAPFRPPNTIGRPHPRGARLPNSQRFTWPRTRADTRS